MKKISRERSWQMWLPFGIVTLLLGCGEIGGSGQCGGAEDTGSCVKIESIVPTYEVGGGVTSNVDAFIDICDATVAPIEIETITDHNAAVTFRNEPLPGADTTTARDVTITRYTLTYSLNDCPAGAICPTLRTQTVTPGETLLIKANSTLSRDLKFVDLSKKMEYATDIGDDMFGIPFGTFTYVHTLASLEFPSYTVTYDFEGTDIFNNPITLRGYSEFTIGDFDNCS